MFDITVTSCVLYRKLEPYCVCDLVTSCFLFYWFKFLFSYVAQSIHVHFCHMARICNLILLISVLYHLVNKKLRYREEHSASVVLSWCSSSHLSGENLLMANQPLLHKWPRKLPNSAK